MRVLMILMLCFIETTALPVWNQSPKQSSEPFELQGDKLGDSLTMFVSKHPKAECMDSTKTRTSCYQWVDVSIFGMTAHPDSGCSLKSYSSAGCVQGLTAQFADHRLILLSYAVVGMDKTEPTSALKKTYGAPLIDTREATIWSRDNATASVVVGKATETNDGPTLVTFVISTPN
ncbi:MAG TPA: hypothetical protein VN830_04505 [Verrucomicrobiae bacterium]|nr:hypothetical protein [Verrucomicrobiae bacterium]